MIDLVRQEIITDSKTIVVKVGTHVLTHRNGSLNLEQITALTDQLIMMHRRGHHVVLVSSGAVGAGIGRMKLPRRPEDLAHLQAVAAVGQSALIQAYDTCMQKHGLFAAQILLTADDMDHRTKYLNIRNTIHALLKYGAIPIINENDTTSVAELQTTFGDNDHLAALVTNLIGSPLLILLSDIDGFYNGDPKDASSCVIPTVYKLDHDIQRFVRDSHDGFSKGGMTSKLRVAHQITSSGGSVILANGNTPNILKKIMNYENCGTLFLPQGLGITARKQWIGYAVHPRGGIIVDDGARMAVELHGKSLLPIGVRRILGDFERGDVISLRDASENEFARGLTNYSSSELWKIRGLRTSEIPQAMGGTCPYTEVVHCDNLTILTIH
ncbi:MAG: glutamate 5-kinase [Planctomycetia bacterium]|nr:glutamate 5-kinase [Planctomycetia bacterium]